MVHQLARPGGHEDLERLIERLRAPPRVEFLAGEKEVTPKLSLPSPTPGVSRPSLSRSSVAVSRATLAGRRRASRVTMGPSRMRSVAVVIAVSVIHGSATSTTGAIQCRRSQTNIRSQPADSA
jgi:hypothetical protein